MKALCVFYNPTATPEMIEMWGITGLLHDADYEQSADSPEKHGILITQKVNLEPEIAHAIQAHNYHNTKIEPQTAMDWAIATCDQLTGLIVAATLISPSKKIAEITPDFVLKRFGEKSFAKGADRATIKLCETKLNTPLSKFVEIVLFAMQQIAQPLGL